MARRLVILSMILLAVGIFTPKAQAQSRFYPGFGAGFAPGFGPFVGAGFGPAFGPGFGPGFGFGPRVGPFFGPGLWGWGFFPFYPAALGTSWANGNTLYGPPVNPGGPVPGSFGASDSVYQRNVGIYGAARDFNPVVPPANYSGPRFGTRDVKRRYEEERRNPQIAIDRAYRDLQRASPWPVYRR